MQEKYGSCLVVRVLTCCNVITSCFYQLQTQSINLRRTKDSQHESNKFSPFPLARQMSVSLTVTCRLMQKKISSSNWDTFASVVILHIAGFSSRRASELGVLVIIHCEPLLKQWKLTSKGVCHLIHQFPLVSHVNISQNYKRQRYHIHTGFCQHLPPPHELRPAHLLGLIVFVLNMMVTQTIPVTETFLESIVPDGITNTPLKSLSPSIPFRDPAL